MVGPELKSCWAMAVLQFNRSEKQSKIEIIILLKEKNVNKAYPCNRALALQKKSVLFKHENLLFLCYMQINIKKEALVEKRRQQITQFCSAIIISNFSFL